MHNFFKSISGTPNKKQALRRFAVTITIVNLLGHLYIGFETSYACTMVSVANACFVQALLEWIRSKIEGQEPLYAQMGFIDFLLPAYIVGMTCAMFLFTNGKFLPLIFATTVAIGSKFILRIRAGERSLHFLNPSNLAIVVSLALFPAVAIIMPYSFSAGLGDIGDVLFPGVLFTLGCFVNGVLTKRLILIFTWLATFVAMAVVRSVFFDAQLVAVLAVATGPIPILYSFYMISDPGTTPNDPVNQAWFGFSIGALYCLLTVNHVVYGIFIALTLTCLLRGLLIVASERLSSKGEPALAAASTAS